VGTVVVAETAEAEMVEAEATVEVEEEEHNKVQSYKRPVRVGY
jgi:hypothetical protein